MKRIIYSLVMMLALGSLFTSCVDPVEPAGLEELRLAKAEYYKALAKLKIADASVQEANAVLINAQADFEKAKAEGERVAQQIAQQQAATDKALAEIQIQLGEIAVERERAAAEYEKKMNELAYEGASEAQKLELEKQAAELEAALAELDAQTAILEAQKEEALLKLAQDKEKLQNEWELYKLQYQAQLAQAQKELEDALRLIELDKLTISKAEKGKINAITNAYKEAAANYQEAQEDLLEFTAKKIQFEAQYTESAADYEKFLNDKLAVMEYQKGRIEEEMAMWKRVREEYVSEWADEINALRETIESYKPQIIAAQQKEAYFWATEEPILDKARQDEMDAAKAEYEATIEELAATRDAALKAAQDAYNEAIKAIGKAPKVPAIDSSFSGKYVMPINKGAHDIIDLYESYVDAANTFEGSDKTDGVNYADIRWDSKYSSSSRENVDTLVVKVEKLNANIKKDIMYGEGGKHTQGLWYIYNTLMRPYVYDYDADANLVESNKVLREAIAAYKDSIEHLYFGKAGFETDAEDCKNSYKYEGVYGRMLKTLKENKNSFDTAWNAIYGAWYEEVVADYVNLASLRDKAIAARALLLDTNAFYTENISDRKAGDGYDVAPNQAKWNGGMIVKYAKTAKDTVAVVNAMKVYAEGVYNVTSRQHSINANKPVIDPVFKYITTDPYSNPVEAKVALRNVVVDNFKLVPAQLQNIIDGGIHKISIYDNFGHHINGAERFKNTYYVDALAALDSTFGWLLVNDLNIDNLKPTLIHPMYRVSTDPEQVVEIEGIEYECMPWENLADVESDAAQALYTWLKDNYIYYGECGHEGSPLTEFCSGHSNNTWNATPEEVLGFDLRTWDGAVYFDVNKFNFSAEDMNLYAEVLGDIEHGNENDPWFSEFAEILQRIKYRHSNEANCVAIANWTVNATSNTSAFNGAWVNTLVFKVLAAREYNRVLNDNTIRERWQELYEILEQVEADLNEALDRIADENVAAAEAKAKLEAYNKAKKKIVDAKKNADDAANQAFDKDSIAAKKLRDSIDNAAKKKYKDALEAQTHETDSILVGLQRKTDDLNELIDRLCQIYESALFMTGEGQGESEGTKANDSDCILCGDLYCPNCSDILPCEGCSEYMSHISAIAMPDCCMELVDYMIQVYLVDLQADLVCIDEQIGEVKAELAMLTDANFVELAAQYFAFVEEMYVQNVNDCKFWFDFFQAKYNAMMEIYSAQIAQ